VPFTFVRLLPVIPSEVAGSRDETLKLAHRDPSTLLGMTGYLFLGIPARPNSGTFARLENPAEDSSARFFPQSRQPRLRSYARWPDDFFSPALGIASEHFCQEKRRLWLSERRKQIRFLRSDGKVPRETSGSRDHSCFERERFRIALTTAAFYKASASCR
jgi:hypothetical protein